MYLMINYSSKWWYKLITIILVIAFIFYFSVGFAPKAHAVVVSTVIVGSVLAAMAAAGVGLAVSGMTAQELTQWVSDKLDDWTTDIGGSVQDHINGNLITVTANGILSIGAAAAGGIADFISWLTNEDQITDNSQITAVQGNTFINGIAVATLPTVVMIDGNNYSYQYESVDSTSLYCYYQTEQPYTGVLVFSIDPSASGYNFYFDGNLFQTYSFNERNNGYAYYTRDKFGPAPPYWDNYYPNIKYAGNPYTVFGANPTLTQNGSIVYDTGVITIPTIDTNDKWYIDVGADAGEDVDTVTDGVITDTLTNTLEVSDEIVESNAQEVVIVNEDSIAVNVDHHMIGFSNLPDFAHLNLNSIWHYVSDAVDFASSWLAWFVSFLSAMPLLAIPLYMSFTLLVVLSFLRRFI